MPFPGSQPGNGSRTGETTLVGAAVTSADSSAGSTWERTGGLEPPCVDVRWRLGCRDFPNPSLWCSVSSSVGVLQAPGSEMPIIIQNMIRMCVPGTECFLPGSFPAQGGSRQGSVLLIFFFSFTSFWALWMGVGENRTEDKLDKTGRAQTPPLPGPCWSQGISTPEHIAGISGWCGAPWCRSKQGKWPCSPLEHSQLIDPGRLFVQLVSRSVRTMFLTSFLPSPSTVPTEGLADPSDFGLQNWTRRV